MFMPTLNHVIIRLNFNNKCIFIRLDSSNNFFLFVYILVIN